MKRNMKWLLLGMLLCSCAVMAAEPDSTRMSSALPTMQAAETSATEIQSADSSRESGTAMQAWILPLAVVAVAATAFVLLFTLRSR
jgi:hypothetical protein